MRTSDFDYFLPPELIAQQPASRRDASRLLVVRRPEGEMAHRHFSDLPAYLRAGDVLVLNDSKVIPARLRGRNSKTGGSFEVLLLKENGPNDWWVMLRPGKRARVDTRILFQNTLGEDTQVEAVVLDTNEEGHRRLGFSGTPDILENLQMLGEVPLPPYIKRTGHEHRSSDLDRYQTVYAQVGGSVAAPTAGLHFTAELLERIRAVGVQVCKVTLHVGLGTFAPVKAEQISEHVMHSERYEINPATAQIINAAKADGRRVIAVGTTSVRVMESVAAAHEGKIAAGSGQTRIFIYPPWRFRVTDALVSNFHLPGSTLLMLVSAFAAPGETRGREVMLAVYTEAIKQRYRFFSYGDATLIL